MAAISQILYEDHLRHSDTGAAAIEAERKEEEEFIKLLQANEEINVKIAKERELRLQKESIIEEEEIRNKVIEFEKEKLKQDREMEEYIHSETLAIENRIRLEDLEKTIETALDNPLDYEFAIDLEGYIYRGRETKSVLVPDEEREKIRRPPTESEILLNSHESEN